MTATDALDCQDLVELVTAYLEGALTPADRRRFEAHLAECEGCEAYVGQIRTTVRLSSRTGRRRPGAPDARRAARGLPGVEARLTPASTRP